MNWLAFALMTVVSWGLYGAFLHTGQLGMADPVNGRYKAFLFVGLAYFLTAVLAPLARPQAPGSGLDLSRQRRHLVPDRRQRGSRRSLLRPPRLRSQGNARRGDDDRLRRSPPRERAVHDRAAPSGWGMGEHPLAVLRGAGSRGDRGRIGDALQAGAGAPWERRHPCRPANQKIILLCQTGRAPSPGIEIPGGGRPRHNLTK